MLHNLQRPAAPTAPLALELKKQPRQARARLTVDAVIEAAEEILANEGYAALTTDHLATIAGVCVGSIYEYFPSKESIVAEVVRRLLDEVVAELRTTNADAYRAGPRAWLTTWIGSMFAMVRERRALVRVLLLEVPYLAQIDEIRKFPMTMLGIAAASPCELRELPFVTPAAMYLLTVMVSSAVSECVLEPPAHLDPKELEDTLVLMLQVLLTSALIARDQASA